MTLIQSGEPKGSLLVQIRKIKGETNMPSQNIFDMKVSKVYPLLLQKVVRKGRTKEELDAVIAWMTGYDMEKLTVMQTLTDEGQRYQCVWTCAGEDGDQVGRACILDDGNYHYVVAVMGGENTAGDMTQIWQDMLDSFDIF